jgi:hypothetical protein
MVPRPNQKEKEMSEAPESPALPQMPETPFNGIVVSVQKTEHPVSRSEYPGSSFSFAIVSEDDPRENAPVVFCSCGVGTDVEPKVHIREGDRVKVAKISSDSHAQCFIGHGFQFDPSLIARRYLKKPPTEPTDTGPPPRPETPFNGVVISVDRSLLKIGAYAPHVCINVAIMNEDDATEHPQVVFHLVRGNRNPLEHLQPGHRVRVKGVRLVAGQVEANLVEFDPGQLAASYRARSTQP